MAESYDDKDKAKEKAKAISSDPIKGHNMHHKVKLPILEKGGQKAAFAGKFKTGVESDLGKIFTAVKESKLVTEKTQNDGDKFFTNILENTLKLAGIDGENKVITKAEVAKMFDSLQYSKLEKFVESVIAKYLPDTAEKQGHYIEYMGNHDFVKIAGDFASKVYAEFDFNKNIKVSELKTFAETLDATAQSAFETSTVSEAWGVVKTAVKGTDGCASEVTVDETNATYLKQQACVGAEAFHEFAHQAGLNDVKIFDNQTYQNFNHANFNTTDTLEHAAGNYTDLAAYVGLDVNGTEIALNSTVVEGLFNLADAQ